MKQALNKIVKQSKTLKWTKRQGFSKPILSTRKKKEKKKKKRLFKDFCYCQYVWTEKNKQVY